MIELDLPPKRPARINIVGVGDEGSRLAREMRSTGTEHADFILETEEPHAKRIEKRLSGADIVFFSSMPLASPPSRWSSHPPAMASKTLPS